VWSNALGWVEDQSAFLAVGGEGNRVVSWFSGVVYGSDPHDADPRVDLRRTPRRPYSTCFCCDSSHSSTTFMVRTSEIGDTRF
jgi:hypothetical protein